MFGFKKKQAESYSAFEDRKTQALVESVKKEMEDAVWAQVSSYDTTKTYSSQEKIVLVMNNLLIPELSEMLYPWYSYVDVDIEELKRMFEEQEYDEDYEESFKLHSKYPYDSKNFIEKSKDALRVLWQVEGFYNYFFHHAMACVDKVDAHMDMAMKYYGKRKNDKFLEEYKTIKSILAPALSREYIHAILSEYMNDKSFIEAKEREVNISDMELSDIEDAATEFGSIESYLSYFAMELMLDAETVTRNLQRLEDMRRDLQLSLDE